jgi:hypothetical protein
MSKHVLDKAKVAPSDEMIQAFTRIPHEEKPSRATLALQRRPKDHAESSRLKEFARIDGEKSE